MPFSNGTGLSGSSWQMERDSACSHDNQSARSNNGMVLMPVLDDDESLWHDSPSANSDGVTGSPLITRYSHRHVRANSTQTVPVWKLGLVDLSEMLVDL